MRGWARGWLVGGWRLKENQIPVPYRTHFEPSHLRAVRTAVVHGGRIGRWVGRRVREYVG